MKQIGIIKNKLYIFQVFTFNSTKSPSPIFLTLFNGYNIFLIAIQFSHWTIQYTTRKSKRSVSLNDLLNF